MSGRFGAASAASLIAVAKPATRRGALGRFLDANTRLSRKLGDGRFQSGTLFYRRYDELVGEAAAAVPTGSLIVDLGGGRGCSFAERVDRTGGTRLVAVDVSATELALNRDADQTVVADVSEGLPFGDGEVDVLVSRTCLEHVDGVRAAAGQMARVLKPGARTLHLVPCRRSLFALAARLLPFDLALSVLHKMIPQTAGVVEFETHYDQCEPAGLERAFRQAGFSEVSVEACYAQAEYFRAFFPAYVAVAAYQWLTRRLGLRGLAAYALVDATR